MSTQHEHATQMQYTSLSNLVPKNKIQNAISENNLFICFLHILIKCAKLDKHKRNTSQFWCQQIFEKPQPRTKVGKKTLNVYMFTQLATQKHNNIDMFTQLATC